MPSFDANSFLTRQAAGGSTSAIPDGASGTFVGLVGGGGGDPLTTIRNISVSFGVPDCLFDLMQNPLIAQLIPTPALVPVRVMMEEAETKTQYVINKIARWIKVNLGISIFPDRNGQYGFFSDINKWGVELFGSEFIQAINSLMANVNAAVNAASLIYANYLATLDQIKEIQNCFGDLQAFLGSSRGEGAAQRDLASPGVYQATLEGENAFAQAQLENAQEYQAKALKCIQVIDEVLAARELDPSLEPQLVDVDPEPTESVFRLQAGPPRAINGEFVLSVDGLYYDSSEGLMPALMELANKRDAIEREKHWKLDFDPSIGGRGKELSSENVRYYFNNLLDPKQIDESKALQKFYNQDRILLSIEGQRDRKVFDVSSEITEMTNNGDAQVLIDNMKQNLLSEVSYYTEKADKRKKQIELAVKIPVLYGKGPIYAPGEIPINDFSYMEGSNFLMDIDQQRELVISQDDVEGVVLPLEVKYTQKIEKVDPVVVDHLLLPGISRGAIIDHDAPSSTAPLLPLIDTLVESNLIALYNVLTAKTSTSKSEDFGLFNSSENGAEYNAKIVGDASSLFKNGLGTAFLEGVSSNSYIRLPAVSPLQDLLYSKQGATFESWIQLSGLTTNSSYNQDGSQGLYRLLLANENTGLASGITPQLDREVLSLDEGTSVVRGMVMGFTRDRRFTASAAASNAEIDNPAESAVFVIAPTQSYDSSSLGFINKEPCGEDNTRWHGLTIPVSSITNNVSFSDCGSTFCHLAVTFDPTNDKVSVYLDSKLLTTSNYYDTFGTGKFMTPKIPSLALSSSFEYSGAGPGLDKFFTPWIIGGGYTDGLSEGFTGGTYGGKTSALQGKVGGIKFYSRPLSSSQVLKNYNANKNFFKFVKLV